MYGIYKEGGKKRWGRVDLEIKVKTGLSNQYFPFVLRLKILFSPLEIGFKSVLIFQKTLLVLWFCYFPTNLRFWLTEGAKWTLLALFKWRNEFQVQSNVFSKELIGNNLLINSGPWMNGKTWKHDICLPHRVITLHLQVLLLRETTAVPAKATL